MIRIKLETAATGTGSPVAFTVPAGFSADVSRILPPTNNTAGQFQYVLLDANGTAWEHGYGRISGTDFYRSTVIASTNGNAALDLSAGTHTILVPNGGMEGRIAQVVYIGSASPGADSSEDFSFVSVRNGVDNALDLPGAVAPSLPDNIGAMRAIVPYARALRAHLKIQSYTTQTGFVQGRIYDNTGSWSALGACHLSTSIANAVATCCTPILNARPPLGVSGYVTSSNIRCDAYNSGAGAVSLDAILTLDFFL